MTLPKKKKLDTLFHIPNIHFTGMAQQGAQGMQPNQGQGLVSQQTPALVAQLQRQMPNQPGGGMMNQQYSQQPY